MAQSSISTATPTSGFTALPPEILAIICDFCLPTILKSYTLAGPNVAPLILGHIFSSLRSVSHSTRRLWTSLSIAYTNHIANDPEQESKQMERLIEQAKFWLKLSHPLPFSLSLRTSPTGPGQAPPPSSESASLFTSAVVIPHLSRFTLLDFGDGLGIQVSASLLSIALSCLESLKSIRIRGRLHHPALALPARAGLPISSSTPHAWWALTLNPHLRRLSLNLPGHTTWMSRIHPLVLWTNLTHLTLENRCNFKEALTILAQTRQLLEVRICASYDMNIPDTSLPVKLVHLTSMDITGCTPRGATLFLSSFDLPSLENLRIDATQGGVWNFDPHIQEGFLQHLRRIRSLEILVHNITMKQLMFMTGITSSLTSLVFVYFDPVVIGHDPILAQLTGNRPLSSPPSFLPSLRRLEISILKLGTDTDGRINHRNEVPDNLFTSTIFSRFALARPEIKVYVTVRRYPFKLAWQRYIIGPRRTDPAMVDFAAFCRELAEHGVDETGWPVLREGVTDTGTWTGGDPAYSQWWSLV